MDSWALSSPNRLAVSDAVIGSVMQRTWNARAQKEESFETRSYRQRTRYRQAPYQKRMNQEYPNDAFESPVKPKQGRSASTILSSIAGLIGQTDSSTGKKRASCLSSDLKTANKIIASIQGANHPITAELQQAIVAEALKKKIRHRERCRINQARYREKQMKVETEIEDAIAKARAEIQSLEARCKVSSRLPTTPTLWAIAAEYLRHFNYYIQTPAMLLDTASKFLRDTMAPDVMIGSLFGVEAQIENWRLFSLYFDAVHVELKDMKMPTSDTLVASTDTTVTITSNTLRRMFPHLNSDGHGGTKGGAWTPLVARMLDQKLVVRGSVFFHWDITTDKVARVLFQADMLTPILNLLGSLEDTSFVFSKALITPECGLSEESK